MAVQEEGVSGTAAQELHSDPGVLDISEAEALDLMYGKAFGYEGPVYTGPHAFTVDVLMEKWGYKSRSTVDKRMAASVANGDFMKVKLGNPAGTRPLNAWVLTEIYEAWEDGNSN